MEPRIQYAKTSDGVSIAYAVSGDGPALVHTPEPGWGIRLSSWQMPEARACYERLARRRTLVGYDSRGTGESDRHANDYSLKGFLRDLEAVVDGIGLESFALLGEYGPVEIAYAARYPERVSHLILWRAVAAASTYWESSRAQAFSSLRSMAGQEWELYVKTMVNTSYSGAGGDLLERLAELWRRSVSPSELAMIQAGMRAHDATSLLSQVRAPTLVIHWRDSTFPPAEEGRRIGAAIPGAELVVLEGEDYWPDVGRTEAAMRAVDEFLGEPEPIAHASVPGGPEAASGTAVILFADIVDSTALTERLGDAVFREKARDVAAALRSIIGENGGRTIEGPTLGDGVLATFTSARQAIEAALACGRAGASAEMPLHLGLHAGDVIRESDPDGRANVYGGAVNIASRISGLSAPGEVLVSETVRSLARTSAGVSFQDRGEQALKGVGEAVRVWAVREGA